MAGKKTYPGGFRLTLATARKLAVQEFGTAKGLERDRSTCLEGHFRMETGNLAVSIQPDSGMSGCIVVRVGLCTASHRLLQPGNPGAGLCRDGQVRAPGEARGAGNLGERYRAGRLP